MRLSFISDTHEHPLESWKVSQSDILIHTGDFSYQGTLRELLKFVAEFKKAPATHKILIPGNHDWGFQRDPHHFRDICEQNGIILLMHEYLELEGLKIFGSPWQPYFCNWAFNVPDSEDLRRLYRDIPPDLDILATHCPPKGILDLCDNGNVGSQELMDQIHANPPRIHAFGHIHEGYGTHHSDQTTFINSSACDELYQAVNNAVAIHLNT